MKSSGRLLNKISLPTRILPYYVKWQEARLYTNGVTPYHLSIFIYKDDIEIMMLDFGHPVALQRDKLIISCRNIGPRHESKNYNKKSLDYVLMEGGDLEEL